MDTVNEIESNIEVNGAEKLTPMQERFVDICWGGFEHGQFDPVLEQHLFELVHELYPGYYFEKGDFDPVLQELIIRSTKYIRPFKDSKDSIVGTTIIKPENMLHPRVFKPDGLSPIRVIDVRNETGHVVNVLKSSLNNTFEQRSANLVELCINGMISRDLNYISGRPTKLERVKAKGIEEKSFRRDPFSMQICDFVILGKPPISDEFKVLFATLKIHLIEKIRSGEWNEKTFPELYAVINAYDDKHKHENIWGEIEKLKEN